MAKIFLHIGINKTGTTAIQSFFSHHRKSLADKGLLYPKSGCTGAVHYALTEALDVNKNIDPETLLAKRQAMRAELDAEIAQHAPKAVLLSSEMFVRFISLEAVSEFFKQDDLCILVYLRRHDTWWQAAYSQFIITYSRGIMTKTPPPWAQGIDAFIRLSRKKSLWKSNYRQLLDRWAAAFGRENIIVRPYESQQNAPDIVVDFLRTISMKTESDFTQLPDLMDIRSARRNISITPRAMQLAEIFLRTQIAADIRERLIRHAISLPRTEANQSILSPARRLKLIEKNAADYEYIAREYMGREDGRLFYDPLPDPNEPWQPPDPLTQQEIVEETVAALLAPKIETTPNGKQSRSFWTWLKKRSGRSL